MNINSSRTWSGLIICACINTCSLRGARHIQHIDIVPSTRTECTLSCRWQYETVFRKTPTVFIWHAIFIVYMYFSRFRKRSSGRLLYWFPQREVYYIKYHPRWINLCGIKIASDTVLWHSRMHSMLTGPRGLVSHNDPGVSLRSGHIEFHVLGSFPTKHWASCGCLPDFLPL